MLLARWQTLHWPCVTKMSEMVVLMFYAMYTKGLQLVKLEVSSLVHRRVRVWVKQGSECNTT